MGAFRVSSTLSATPDTVWRHAVSPAGVNRELAPLLRMTFPEGITDLTASWQPGRTLFRSRLLLAGFLPVEYDDVAFAEVEPGHRFLERSSLLTQRVWEHERTVAPGPAGGCTLTDRLRFEPRLRWLDGLHGIVFSTVFALRHRNLRRLFGVHPAAGA